MTSTQEPPPGEGAEIHPLFLRVAQPYLERFNLDEDAQQVVALLLVRGTREVLRIPEGPDRDEAVEVAAGHLDAAMRTVTNEFESVGQFDIEANTLTTIMQPLCPVPPFCVGTGGPDGGGFAAGFDDTAYAPAEPVYVEA